MMNDPSEFDCIDEHQDELDHELDILDGIDRIEFDETFSSLVADELDDIPY